MGFDNLSIGWVNSDTLNLSLVCCGFGKIKLRSEILSKKQPFNSDKCYIFTVKKFTNEFCSFSHDNAPP